MSAMGWLKERWPSLVQSLEGLTVEQEDEISRLCLAEIEYYRVDRKLSLGTLGNAVSQTRKHLEEHFNVLNESNSWLNPRNGKLVHISVKHMNLSKEEWAARVAPSQEKREARLKERETLKDPDAIVARAVSLLDSRYWGDITVALAVLTGRRLQEMLTVGAFAPHTRYSLTFTGQLKTRDRVMAPYAIPTLCEASLVLAAVDRLRGLAGDSPDEDALTGLAEKHFADLVPGREGDSLYTRLFRAVWGCIAVFYYCKLETLDIVFLNRVYGHYWIVESSGQLQADYNATQSYQDYMVSDEAVTKYGGKRQGVKLGSEGVELLPFLQEKPEQSKKKGTRKMAQDAMTIAKDAGQTEFSMIKPRKTTKVRIDQFIEEESITDSSPYDAALVLLLERSYMMKTITGYGVSLESMAALLGLAAAADDGILEIVVSVLKDVEGVAALLADAAKDSDDPVRYLGDILKKQREFKASYEGRHKGRDYTSMTTSELRRHKTEEAAYERFGRAFAAIVKYNAAAPLPELCWYPNAASFVELVGGSPALAKAYIEAHPEIEAYNKEHGLKPGFNRRGISIKERVTVPELPEAAVESEETIAEE